MTSLPCPASPHPGPPEAPVTLAVILAAGLGTRLMPHTATRPKALVEVTGVPLLRRLLDACEAGGLTRALVVTGHRREALERWLNRYDGGLAVDTVHNDAYDVRGNAWSLYTARHAVGAAGFVKLDGDLLLDGSILPRLLAAAPRSAIVLDRAAALDAEAMKAQLRQDGSVGAMGKWLAATEAHGESLGVEKIDARDAGPLFEAIARVVQAEGRGGAYYEDVYHVLVQRGWRLGVCDSAGAPWWEIDDPGDLARAEAAFATGAAAAAAAAPDHRGDSR